LQLATKRALVTAGPTHEAIDPVRFIGNHSSGKMGYQLALALAEQGAQVDLVSGPSREYIQHPLIKVHRVTSAKEMFECCVKLFPSCQIAVMAAAVADYTPVHVASEKIKKTDDQLILTLQKTADIASTLGQMKSEGQVLIGFALETDQVLDYAREKLIKKNLDMIVANNPRVEGAGFGTETNQISLLWPNNKEAHFGLKAKSLVAKDIVTEIVKLVHA
jgi:phosphopantothenoylcysteine decarboxylase / phosphopantothenate---cysteine ligase